MALQWLWTDFSRSPGKVLYFIEMSIEIHGIGKSVGGGGGGEGKGHYDHTTLSWSIANKTNTINRQTDRQRDWLAANPNHVITCMVQWPAAVALTNNSFAQWVQIKAGFIESDFFPSLYSPTTILAVQCLFYDPQTGESKVEKAKSEWRLLLP